MLIIIVDMLLPLTQHVTNQELSKRLKEIGCPQISMFWWVMKHPYSLVLPGPSWELKYIGELVDWKDDEYIAVSAFLASELGEWLPRSLEGTPDSALICMKIHDRWNCGYYEFGMHHPYGLQSIRPNCRFGWIFMEHAPTLPDAMGKMIVYLKEKGLIKF